MAIGDSCSGTGWGAVHGTDVSAFHHVDGGYHAAVHWGAGQGHCVAVLQHMDVVVAGTASGSSADACFHATDGAAAPRSCAANAAMAVGAHPATRASPQAAEAAGVSPTGAARGRRCVGA